MPPVVNPFTEQQFEREVKSGYLCTVASILPVEIFEEKPHIIPSVFRIPATVRGDGSEINILHVGEAIHYIPSPFDGTSIKQTTSPMKMAESIVNDHNSAHIGLSENACPGLFWVEGPKTAEDIKKNHPKTLADVIKRQMNWFRNLVAIADADWNKNHNVQSVSDVQRAAAKELGLKRDWLDYLPPLQMVCPYCRTNIDPDSIKCINCKEIVNVAKYKELQKELKAPVEKE